MYGFAKEMWGQVNEGVGVKNGLGGTTEGYVEMGGR